MLRNIAGGGAAISVLARRFGYRLWICDVGVTADTSADALPGVLYRRIGAGTRNLAREAAMSVSQARAALEVGVDVARGVMLPDYADRNRRDGNRQQHLGGGVARGVHGYSAARLAGRGAGLDEAGMRRKVAVIDRALKLHSALLKDPLATLAALWGLRDRRDGRRMSQWRGAERAGGG